MLYYFFPNYRYLYIQVYSQKLEPDQVLVSFGVLVVSLFTNVPDNCFSCGWHKTHTHTQARAHTHTHSHSDQLDTYNLVD